MGYLTTYNSVDLVSTCSISMDHVSGVHDLPEPDLDILYLPGCDTAQVTVLRNQMRRLQFDAAVTGADHATMLSYLRILKAALMTDDQFHALVVSDRNGQQIQALRTGFPVDIDRIPALIRGVRFPLGFLAYPYWEDSTPQSVHVVASPTTVANAGDQACYPTYTCAVSDTLAGGLWFQVGTVRFTYTGALVNTDSLVVESDPLLRDVTLNGTRAWAGVSWATTSFPSLAVGDNTVTLSDVSKFHLTVAYRRRYV